MDAIAFAENLLRQLDQEIATVEHHIINGMAEEYTAYIKLVSHRAGLLTARSIVTDLLQSYR